VRILILGGSGLVGRALAADCVKDGHAVSIVCRHPERAVGMGSGIEVVAWDGHSAAGWGHRVDGADAIVSLAGESLGGRNLFQIFFQRWTNAKKRRILESRVNAGKAVVEAVRSAAKRPSVLVQMSAVGYYGPQGDEAVGETTAPGTDFMARVCQAWEQATAEVERLGMRRVVVRTGLVLSMRGGLFPVVLLPFRLFIGGPLGGGRQVFSWAHAEDHRRALRFVIEKQDASGAYNLTAPQPVSNSELGRAIAKALHRPYWFPTPAFVLRLVLGEKATLVLDGRRVLPRPRPGFRRRC